MAAIKVITSEDVMRRMGLQDYDGVANTIASAIKAAEIRFQSLLDTAFENGSQTDIFYIEPEKFPVVENNMFKLRLKKAFVNPAAAMVVRAARTLDAVSTGLPLDTPQYLVTKDKGIVHIDASFVGNYVSITYLSGFSDSNKPPDWLKEAMLAYMPYVLNNQQTTNRNAEQGEITKNIADLSAQMVAPYMRGVAWQYKAIY